MGVNVFGYVCVDETMYSKAQGVSNTDLEIGCDARLVGEDLVGGMSILENGRKSSLRGSKKSPDLNAPSKRSMCDWDNLSEVEGPRDVLFGVRCSLRLR